MKKTISVIDQALKNLYNLQTSLRAEDFLLAVPPGGDGSQPGLLLIEPPTPDEDSLGLGIYLGPGVQETLAHYPAWWSSEQIAAFAVAAEEVSHFHYVAHFVPQGRGVSQLELEFQGEIDKFLLTYFALSEEKSFDWLMVKFFESVSWVARLTAEQRSRYEEASRLAKAFLVRHGDLLSRKETKERFLKIARDFYRLSFEEKVSRATR